MASQKEKNILTVITAGSIIGLAMVLFYGTGAYLNILKIRKEKQQQENSEAGD